MPDPVYPPPHYGGAGDPYEAIKVIEAWEVGFNLGNTLKYIRRYRSGSLDQIPVNLKKARWYLDREIQKWEKQDAAVSDQRSSGRTVSGPRPGNDKEGSAPVPHRKEARGSVLSWELIDPYWGRSYTVVPQSNRTDQDYPAEPSTASPPPPEAARNQTLEAWNAQRIQELEDEERDILYRYHAVIGELGKRRAYARQSCGQDQESAGAAPVRGTIAPVTGAGDPSDS